MTFMTILQTQLLWVPAMHLQYSILNDASAAPVGTRTGPEMLQEPKPALFPCM